MVPAPCPIADNQREVLEGLTPDVVNTLSKLAKLMNCSNVAEATASDDLIRSEPEALDEVVAQIIRVSNLSSSWLIERNSGCY